MNLKIRWTLVNVPVQAATMVGSGEEELWLT